MTYPWTRIRFRNAGTLPPPRQIALLERADAQRTTLATGTLTSASTADAMCYPSSMHILPLVVGAALLFAVPAKADKFWLSDPEAQGAAGSSPHYIEGVLLVEDAEGYHVRVAGGEILLPKKAVFRIEKDALTIDAIVQAENEQKERAAASRPERKVVLGPSRRRGATATEASVSRREADASPAAGPAFDPIVGHALPPRSDAELARDLQLAWSLTKDRSYLEMLRRLRRAH